MKFVYSVDTIIACSTSTASHAAISLVRISGFKDLKELRPYFSFTGPIEPRKVYYTKLIFNGTVVDDICLVFFEGPKSYSGENILELSVHGNTLNVERILGLFISEAHCRLASPGEFTYRALKNKKLNLSQVEGLDLFLNANSTYALKEGLSLLNGDLHEHYLELFNLFLIHKSSLELSIDFADDIGEKAAEDYFHSSLLNFQNKLESLHRRVAPMDFNLINPEIILAGPPNSGKSTFFNLLLKEQRAIVSPIAGTTRDYLSESLVIKDVRYKVIDTAGIHQTQDTIEAEGIKRSQKKLTHGFYTILLINPFEVPDDFRLFFEEGESASAKFDEVLLTHSDVEGFEEARSQLLKSHSFLGPTGAVNLKGDASSLEKELFERLNNKYLSVMGSSPILLDRHKLLILKALDVFLEYKNLATSEKDVAILSDRLNSLASCLSELIGIVSPEDVLNSIFSNFCIGK